MIHARTQLVALAANLRWTWHGHVDRVFREIDQDLWRRVNHNPTAFLADVDPEKIDACAADPLYRERLDRVCRHLAAYVATDRHWGARHVPALEAAPVAYFSPEFALHESLPIYSGGLGVLAGDHLKSCSDCGIPIWGVTLLYREGYFRQLIDAEGRQHEEYEPLDLARAAVEPVRGPNGAQLTIDVPVDHTTIPVLVWRSRVGRANLLLLDPSAGTSSVLDDLHANRLYAGSARTRLVQEIILGIGGYLALRAIGVRPGVLHLNEGHSAFALLEAIAETRVRERLSFEDAAKRVRARAVFTTHTPVAAGHDRFEPGLIDAHLGGLASRLGLTMDEFLALGRVDPGRSDETFCMTVLALRLSGRSNAVSALHGRTTRAMWNGLYPTRHVDDVPVGHVTNGVHVPSWISPEMSELLRERVSPTWADHVSFADMWDKIRDVDPFELWEAKSRARRRMAEFVARREQSRSERLGRPPAPPLDPHALTIGFARRFVEYKRAALLFRDPDRLERLLCHPARPVQLVFAGKAHPADQPGKEILRRVQAHAADPRFGGRIVLVEDYDMNVGRHLVQGCDLWLNLPRRPLEACGTSGQKAVYSGTLNLAVLDGWWAEAYDGKNGFAVGDDTTIDDAAQQDDRDAASLYEVLEREVVPEFFDRAAHGIPLHWIRRMQRAIATLGWRFNSDRMVMDYARGCYAPAAGLVQSAFPTER